MRKKDLGAFLMGDFRIRLVITDQWGGAFYFAYKGSLPLIEIGTASDSWERILSVFIHEAFEFEVARLGYRFSRSNDFGNDHSEYVFMFNHPQFSDVCGRVATFVSNALPALAKAWKEFKRKPCSKKQRKGSRNSKKSSRKKAKRIAGSGKPVSNT